jgi:PKD domain
MMKRLALIAALAAGAALPAAAFADSRPDACGVVTKAEYKAITGKTPTGYVTEVPDSLGTTCLVYAGRDLLNSTLVWATDRREAQSRAREDLLIATRAHRLTAEKLPGMGPRAYYTQVGTAKHAAFFARGIFFVRMQAPLPESGGPTKDQFIRMARLEYKRSVLNGVARIKHPRRWPTGGLRAGHLPAISSPSRAAPGNAPAGAPATTTPSSNQAPPPPACPPTSPEFVVGDFPGVADQNFLLVELRDQTTVQPCGRPIVAWTWDFGDPASGAANTSTLQNPQHQFSAYGVYHVTMTATDDHQVPYTFALDVNVPQPVIM